MVENVGDLLRREACVDGDDRGAEQRHRKVPFENRRQVRAEIGDAIARADSEFTKRRGGATDAFAEQLVRVLLARRESPRSAVRKHARCAPTS